MLVLSRRPNEKVCFPSISASVQVVSIKPGVVRLGIEAPAEVPVIREEILDSAQCQRRVAMQLGHTNSSKSHDLNHQVRNRLHAVTIGLAFLRRHLKAGLTAVSESTFDMIDQEMQAIRNQIEADKQPAKSMPVPKSHKLRTLLVEDDSNERELLAGFLRMAGLDVATAGDGAGALDYLHAQARPDVVLLDMVLPRCDGSTIVREIRSDPALAGLKIFAVTGHSPDRFGLADGSAGIDRWFNKPLNPEAFLRDLSHELGLE